jgi:hypothetical protein
MDFHYRLLAGENAVRGLLDWKAPIWAQVVVSTASLLVAVMRVYGAFRRRAWFDSAILLVCGVVLIMVAYTGLKSHRAGEGQWGWGAVMAYGVFGAVLFGIGLLLAWR